MYLSTLKLHGFKSFASHTELHFDPGVTAVVGPNGCGKSNIVDAVRWVIGEQRARVLRSEKMDNLIFNGTSKRRPLGMAEVKLTIENTRGVLPVEYSEVTIGRRLYRSGESEYLLNGVQCRLKDITDLFMDTGMGAGAYSVIELKMIEEILSDNAHDRRRLFEEAAGITKYKLRRAQTLRKLDATQTDLTRLRDIVEEIEKRVRSLKRQANKASRHRELEQELRGLELALAYLEYDRLAQQKLNLDDEIKSLHDDLEGQNAQQGRQEAEVESLRTLQISREEALLRKEAKLQEHIDDVRKREADLRLLHHELEVHERDRLRFISEKEEARERSAELRNAIAVFEERLGAAKPELERRTELLEAARDERDRTRAESDRLRDRLAELREREVRLSEELSSQQRQLDRLVSRTELLEQDEHSCVIQISELQSGDVAIEAELSAAAAAAAQARSEVDAHRRRVVELEERRSGVERDLHEATDVLRQIEKQREAAAAEAQLLSSLVTSYEDFSEAVQFLAERSSVEGRELRTVADIVLCDDDDRLALEAALGEMAACVVVRTEAEAVQAMNTLRVEDKGRATFLVLSRLDRAATRLERTVTGRGTPMANLVRVDATYRSLVELLLHNCLMADSTEEAAEIANALDGAYRVFSRSGEWVDARGIFRGGSRNRTGSNVATRLGRREQLDAARERLAEYDKELATCASRVDELKTLLASYDLATSRAELSDAELLATETDKVLARVEFRHGSLQERRREVETRLESIRATTARTAEDIRVLEQSVKLSAAEVETTRTTRVEVETEFHAAEAVSRTALTAFSDANLQAVQMHNEVDNIERDIERNRGTVLELAGKAETLAAALVELAETIRSEREREQSLSEQLAKVRLKRPELEEAVSSAKDALMETRAQISNLEVELRRIRQSREAQMREENTRAVRLAEIQTRMEDLVNHIAEDYGVQLLDAEIDLPEDLEEIGAREKVHTLRERIRGMGPVNALALEEYEQEKERLDFLSTQLQDLEQAEKTLIETIEEINTTASQRFDETFSAIRENFAKLFEDLFGGEATADVVLENPSDPLESAIEVFARPRGKRPSVLAQLSGGEKTLTAIALLFAIYLVKPSPFCILDEVDAPLDDANISRFMHLIRSFADTTQFILVTHNKRTMEAADRMYGITMQEQGVSNLVGVRFEEAMETAPATVV